MKLNFYVIYKDNYQYSEVFDNLERAEEYLYYVQTMEPKSKLHLESILEEYNWRDFEDEESKPEENRCINGKKFADMILEYDSKKEEMKMHFLCWKWANETDSQIEMYRKVYQFSKKYWDENELKLKITTECFSDKNLCEEIFK